MGKYFNVEMKDIKSAIEAYIPQNNRSQIIQKNGRHIILDAYNANPSSMKVALENFSRHSGEPKIAFLGDMFELGKTASSEHQYIADLALELDLDKVFLIGENFHTTKTSFKKFKDYDAMAAYLSKEKLATNSNILIKGSRGMALERLLGLL
jgi:UDP-N-acetylmuramoyl-tripeptide--D-alanyl-D-alanine ligase